MLLIWIIKDYYVLCQTRGTMYPLIISVNKSRYRQIFKFYYQSANKVTMPLVEPADIYMEIDAISMNTIAWLNLVSLACGC